MKTTALIHRKTPVQEALAARGPDVHRPDIAAKCASVAKVVRPHHSPTPAPVLTVCVGADAKANSLRQLDALTSETKRLTRPYEQKPAAVKKSLPLQAFTGEL